jgi:hypothetical protein
MGNSTDKLQVKEPFVMPEGIHILGDITGLENPVAKAGELKSAFDSRSDYPIYGSGKFVRLKLTVLNSKNIARTIFFPKGLVWECTVGNYQHGLQCQTAWICLQPNSFRTVYVDLYCANLGLPSPNQTGTYNILGVTNSSVLWNLLNLISWRKISYEMINGNYSPGKGTAKGPTYDEITDRLQIIVHNLTDRGIDISAEDKAFIESIPELAPEERPVVDENSQFPEYFEEFKVSGK